MGRARGGVQPIFGINLRGAAGRRRRKLPDGTHTQRWVRDGRYRPRANGEPTSISTFPDGSVRHEWQDGSWRHRTDGPAMMFVGADGSTVEEWDLRGCVHRVGAPASVTRGADGSFREAWMERGLPYREGGPALTRRSADGSTLEVWHETRQGKHRHDGGPAEITVAADGTRTETYYEVGVLHREGGPALLVSAADGTVLKAEHYLAGEAQPLDQPQQAVFFDDSASA